MFKKNIVKPIIFSVIFILGIIILMNSVKLGTNVVDNIMIKSVILNNSVMYYEQYITTYRFLGSILTILGGLDVIINMNDKP